VVPGVKRHHAPGDSRYVSSVRPGDTVDQSLSLAGAVLAFDVDGVLLDPGPNGTGSWQSVLAKRYGVDPTLLDPVFFRARWPRIIIGAEAIEPALADAIAELGWPITVDELLTCWFEADFSVDHQVVEAVRMWTAAGARLVLVTNQEHRRARYLDQRLGTLLPVGGMAYSAALGFTKDHPQFFVAASDLLGIPRHSHSVVFVDDSPENVEVARRHGWTGIDYVKEEGWRSAITQALDRAAGEARSGPGR
jgi:putative hydrolase of the HAD superfamily